MFGLFKSVATGVVVVIAVDWVINKMVGSESSLAGTIYDRHIKEHVEDAKTASAEA